MTISSEELRSLAQKAYEAYCAHFNWISIATGNPLLQWDALRTTIQEGWMISVQSIEHQIAYAPFYNDYYEIFLNTFSRLQGEIHQTAIEKGWWEKERPDLELIALMHSELSEAVEGLRTGNPPDSRVPGFSNVEVELADCIIRIMDMASSKGFNIAGAILAKHQANQVREYRHGGKLY